MRQFEKCTKLIDFGVRPRSDYSRGQKVLVQLLQSPPIECVHGSHVGGLKQ